LSRPKGWHHTEQAKRKIRIAMQGMSQQAKMRERMLGNTYALGNVLTVEQRAKMSQRMKGHPVSDETKKKIGFRTLVIWEHELKQPDRVQERVAEFVRARSIKVGD